VLGFRAVYVAVVLIALFWATSGVREIASDSQVVVRRFGRIVRAQQSGLVVAWPPPIEQVQILPGPGRQLTQDVSVLRAPTEKYEAIVGSGQSQKGAPGQHAGAYLTGDGNVVLLSASLIYRIKDPIAYALEAAHVGPALDRLFRTTAAHITAGRKLNDFLPVQTNVDQSNTGQSLSEVRESLLRVMNDRLQVLNTPGGDLGVEIQQINLTPSFPAGAKAAFDRVLLETQTAQSGVAMAQNDAERVRQQANSDAEQLVSAAQATATEIVSKAQVDTASILALVNDQRTFQNRDVLLLREYRARVANIMNRAGHVTLVDPKNGARVVIPGGQP
jgi:modulator of FtsH protease HflK